MLSDTLAQEARTVFLLEHPADAMVLALHEALQGALHRPNTTSDIRWEFALPSYISALQSSGVGVYDYTKWAARLRGGLYPLTWSATERMSVGDIQGIVGDGRNVAVVFVESKRRVQDAVREGFRWHGMPLVDGIGTDYRLSDPPGSIVALAALGKRSQILQAQRSGFVRSLYA